MDRVTAIRGQALLLQMRWGAGLLAMTLFQIASAWWSWT
ncbi:hypothetical protein FX983_01269 [Pseudomonas frederiksbergensis]|uniref:Uncharacterized protein n=1 Tax=Pseudomonas frederiksbergensis TaxID=104087 RepID=A0A6L5BZA2_9PSED|nr:hypothetical protein FX983_01269 [Pseudomonas frederiksbergensis]